MYIYIYNMIYIALSVPFCFFLCVDLRFPPSLHVALLCSSCCSL